MDKLQKGWSSNNLGDVVKIIGGGTPSKQDKTFYGGNIPWASVRDLNVDLLEKTELQITEEGLKQSSSNIIPKGSLVIATRVGLGKVCILARDTAINQDLKGIIPNCKIDTQFLFYWFKSSAKAIEFAGIGATVKGVKLDFVKSLQIPLPPLPEQTRIVSKLDSLFTRIDKSIALLEENIQHTKGLMASVLEELFEKLKTESTIYKIKEIAEIKGGKRLPKGESIQDEKTDHPYIRVTDFTDDGTIDVNSVKYMSKSVQEQIKRYIITSKDLYISIAGTIGKTGIIPKELEKANLTENAARLVFKPNIKINNRFVYYFTLSDNFKDQVGLATKTVAQPKLALTRLAEVELPIPSIQVQNKEVEIFDELSRKFQDINKQQQSKLNFLKALKSSLLDRAFKGEL